MQNTELVIKEAKKFLKKPRDVVHDLAHHEAVWKNCETIIREENLDVDIDLTKIAAFWHDVVLEKAANKSFDNVKETVEYLERLLQNLDFKPDEIKTVVDAVLHHEFGDIPTNTIGEILQDADKLEVLSPDRWKTAVDGYKNNEISKEKLISYVQTGLKWVPVLESTFHFETSRKI